MEIEPGGTSDKIHATGTASINGGTLQVSAAPGSYANGTQYESLKADGGVTGTYDTFQHPVMIDMQLKYYPTIVSLVIGRLNFFRDFAQSWNQIQIAEALDGMENAANGDMAIVMDELFVLNESDLRHAFDLIGAECFALLPQINLSEFSRYRSVMTQRM